MSRDLLGLEREKAYYTQRLALTGAQYAALAATPLYLVAALRRGSFSIRSLTRYNWTVPLLGAGGGYATGLAVTSQESSASTAARSLQIRKDAKQVRRDDWFLVGSAVGALLTPALFLGRAGLINGALGGAGLGGSVGLLTSLYEEQGIDGLARQAKEAVGQGEAKLKEAQIKGKELAKDAQAKGQQALDKRA